jgi:hypothetical protein
MDDMKGILDLLSRVCKRNKNHRISGALDLDVFKQPVKRDFFSNRLEEGVCRVGRVVEEGMRPNNTL